MNNQNDLLDFTRKKRRSLLPWWIKSFIWIFIAFGTIAPIAIIFGILGKDIQMALYGLKTNEPFTITGILIIVIFIFKAIVSYGLWFEKRWAVILGIIDAYAGLCICIVVFLWNAQQTTNNSFFPLEIIFIIPYLIWLHKIYKPWLFNQVPNN